VHAGGGHKRLGRTPETKRRSRARSGYTHIHTAIDAYSRLAYSEFAGPENTTNCVAFLTRAVAWFAAQGITVERILTDNGNGYRSHAWAHRCRELGLAHGRTAPTGPPPTAR
jgi:transposase InsO family protein